MNQGHQRSTRQVLRLAIWFGLLTGVGEVALLGVKKFYLGQFIRFGPDVIWMTPLADAVLFLIPGLIFAALARRSAAVAAPRTAQFAFAFLGFLSWFLMYYPLQLYAKLLLATGLAMQVVRLITRWRSGFDGLVRRSTLWMLVAVFGLAVGFGAWHWVAYRNVPADGALRPANAPNVLLIVLDTVRAQNLSLYGYRRSTTPGLERLARTSVVFDRATATAPWTLPSHASIFTGRWPHELSANWEAALDDRYPTLAEVLGHHGYATAGFVANTYYCGYELGLNRGFAYYEDYVVSPREFLISSSFARSVANSSKIRRLIGYYDNIPRKNAAAINDHFLSWLSGRDRRPFFAFLNYFDAHETYLPPAPFTERFGPNLPRGNDLLMQDVRRSIRNDWRKRPLSEITSEVDMYDGAIAYLDDQLDRLFRELGTRGVLDDTIVIVTSDHGEQFGEHGFFLHGTSLYEPLLAVPLIISFPGRAPGGVRVAATVSLRDLAATVLDLVGLRDAKALPGDSLARYWSDPASSSNPASDPVLSEVRYADWARAWFPSYPAAKGDMQSLTDDRHHYIKNADGREELYALREDPHEQHDVSGVPENRALLENFRKQLGARLGSSGQ